MHTKPVSENGFCMHTRSENPFPRVRKRWSPKGYRSGWKHMMATRRREKAQSSPIFIPHLMTILIKVTTLKQCVGRSNASNIKRPRKLDLKGVWLLDREIWWRVRGDGGLKCNHHKGRNARLRTTVKWVDGNAHITQKLYAQEDCKGWNIGRNNQPWDTHNQISTEITTTVRIPVY